MPRFAVAAALAVVVLIPACAGTEAPRHPYVTSARAEPRSASAPPQPVGSEATPELAPKELAVLPDFPDVVGGLRFGWTLEETGRACSVELPHNDSSGYRCAETPEVVPLAEPGVALDFKEGKLTEIVSFSRDPRTVDMLAERYDSGSTRLDRARWARTVGRHHWIWKARGGEVEIISNGTTEFLVLYRSSNER